MSVLFRFCLFLAISCFLSVSPLFGQNTASRPYLGIRVASAGTASARQVGIESPVGAAVLSVTAGGPADKARLQRGDLIVEFGGREIKSVGDLEAVSQRSPVGGVQKVIFVRGDKRYFTHLEIGSRAGDAPKPDGKRVETPGGGQNASGPPATAPALPGWSAKTVGDVSLSIPPGWGSAKFASAGEGQWFKGKKISPEASFSLVLDRTIGEMSSKLTVERKDVISVSGRSAQRIFGRLERGGKRYCMWLVFPAALKGDRDTVVLTFYSPEEQWDAYKATFQNILARVRIGGGGR